MFGRYLVTTGRDPDWRMLTTTMHDCYMALVSSEDITWAGVVPYFPARYVLASDLTERKVAKVWDELAALGYLVIDKAVGEVAVRSFIRHDEVLKKPNITKAMCLAFDRIRSPRVAYSILCELGRLMDELGDDLAGFQTMQDYNPDLYTMVEGTHYSTGPGELFTERFGVTVR